MPVFRHRQEPSERSGRAAPRQGTTATRPTTPLLAAQNAAGNTAVVQMLRQAGHNFAPSAPKASADAQPVQRVAKQSVQQPDPEHQSARVPDLPRVLTDAIGRAHSADARTAVLRQLLDYILERFNDLHIYGALNEDQTGLLQNLYERVQVIYSDANSGAMAHTEEQLGQATGAQIDSPPIVITVYADAFNGGAAQLYSTMRHELIHAAQRSMVPDEGQAAATDDVMFEDLYEADTGVDTRHTLQLPLQEIETHVWELTHAGETGIEAGYRGDTVTYLLQYAQALTAGVNAATDKQFTYWVNYLVNAVGLLTEAAAVTDSRNARRLQQAAAALQNAINNRSGSGGSSKRGGSKRSGGGSGGGGKRSGGSGSGSGSGRRKRSRRTAA